MPLSMNVDPSLVLFVLTLGNTLAAVLLWLRKPGQDASAEIVKFKTSVAETDGVLKGRLDVLEERVKHMPTSDELREVEGQLGAMRAQIGGVVDTVQSTRSAVIRIEEFLRNSKH
jgi:hypothetical protein